MHYPCTPNSRDLAQPSKDGEVLSANRKRPWPHLDRLLCKPLLVASRSSPLTALPTCSCEWLYTLVVHY